MLHFIYIYKETKGVCFAKSVAQAIDRIKVNYLAAHKITPSSPSFRLEKSKLTPPWRIALALEDEAKFKRLYVAAREDFISADEREFMDTYKQATHDLDAICPRHLRPSATSTSTL